MDEDFFLTDFSLEDIDFDFDIYNYQENNLSLDEANMASQGGKGSSKFGHHQLPKPEVKPIKKQKLEVKPMKKMSNKPRLISFDFSSNVSCPSPVVEEIIIGRGIKRKACSNGTRSSVLAKEHVLAERKRREKLSEKFIALSALLPGLKKADKVTVLDDAISRMKQLQEQISKLKEEKEATKEIESMILVKKTKVFLDEETCLSPYSSEYEKFDQALPEVEAKISQNEVLIRIHCEKSKWCMIKLLNTIENLQLSIENSIVLPFGNSTLDITILAQMEKDCSVSVVKDLVKNLRLAMV